jgi:putative glycosyltransferase (TIGR04372 family)
MKSLKYYKKVAIAIIFHDIDPTHEKNLSLFSSFLPHNKLFFRFFHILVAFPLSLLAWLLIQIFSYRYKVSIYVLKTFRPGFASTYLCMIEPLCRQLQHENSSRHIKILVDPGEKVSNVLVRSYKPHFNLYLDDRRKFVRLLTYLIPKFRVDKQFIDTSDKYSPNWTYPPSKNYANSNNGIPTDLANLGIQKDNFVLFVHPSMKYYKKMLPAELLINVRNRFVDLTTYSTALANILDKNLKVIRVGLEVDEMPIAFKSIPIIDYSGEFRNEESELWLYENCKILLSVANGAFWFARRFDRPTVITDSYTLIFGYQPTLYTPMTIRNKKSGRLLTFPEILNIRTSPNFLSDQFMEERHLELVPNSSETIASAVDDLLDLSNGRRMPTSEDLELLKSYNSILTSFKIPIKEKMTTPAASFLRAYRHLL